MGNQIPLSFCKGSVVLSLRRVSVNQRVITTTGICIIKVIIELVRVVM